jgi:hypothetical protein
MPSLDRLGRYHVLLDSIDCLTKDDRPGRVMIVKRDTVD